jgi:hypothetical protein
MNSSVKKLVLISDTLIFVIFQFLQTLAGKSNFRFILCLACGTTVTVTASCGSRNADLSAYYGLLVKLIIFFLMLPPIGDEPLLGTVYIIYPL